MKTFGRTLALLAVASTITGSAGAQRSDAPAGKSGPAHSLYKKAYGLVLHEKWEEARREFRELAQKYPDSEYRDDAEYWIAYTWRDSDADRAKKAYRDFLKNYRGSPYFDDALADLDQLMARTLVGIAVPVPSGTHAPTVAATAPDIGGVIADDSLLQLTIRSLPAPAIAPVMKMRHLNRALRAMSPRWLAVADGDGLLDDETRLRLETLYAVGRAGEDDKGFGALRSVAVNGREKTVVRVAAMEALAGYRRHDALPVYVEIARNDTSEEMQIYAIESIGNATRDREKAFDALFGLYRSVPASRVEKRKVVFYSIAELGSDRAVDFLSDVARSGRDPDLRREAIYYLSTIGGERARAVLIDLLERK